MANVTGIDLNPILQRLNSTNNYHPFDAETFSDWATEAGDIVTISRNGETYVSPVHTSRMVWKGKAPTMQISTTGNEKRDAVSRVSRKKYGRGSAGVRSQEGIHRNFVSEDGILHSELHITESYLRTEFHDETNSLRSYFDMTASHMRTEFLDQVHSLRSEFEVTASHLRTEFEDDVNSLRGEFEVTASHMRTEFEDDVNSLRGEFEATASHLRTEFEDEVHSLRGEFEVTASHLRTEFEDDVNSVRSYMHETASSWEARVEGVTDANGNITAASIALAVNSAGSEARINADRIYLLGQTIADTVDANYISTKVAEIPTLSVKTLVVKNSTQVGGPVYASNFHIGTPDSSKNVSLGLLGGKVELVGNNTYRIVGYTFSGDEIPFTGTFSRATTLSGAWSGRNFTVTASPQGNIKSGTVYETIVPDTSDSVAYNANTKQLSRLYYVYSEDENGDADSVILHKTVSIPGDLAYAAGYTDGSASGGSTSLTATWAGGKITVTASPQGATLVRLLQAGAVTWSGTRATIPISSVYGSSGQYSDGVVFTPFVDVSSKLQDKTISSNGTVTPDAGYIGFGSVTVAVPTTNAGARFNAAEGSYFIEAYDKTSGNSIADSSTGYKLGLSGTNVQIQNASGTKYGSTPEYTIPLETKTISSNGTVNPSSGKVGFSSVTVAVPSDLNKAKARFNASSGQYFIEAYDSSSSGAYSIAGSSVTYKLGFSGRTVQIQNASGSQLSSTPTLTLGISNGTLSSGSRTLTVTAGGSNTTATTTITDYKDGWAAYYTALKWPEVPSTLSATFSVKRPSSTVGSASDKEIRNYVISSKDDNTVYLRYNNQTYAEFAHNKHTAGYNSAKLTLNTSTKKVTKTSSGSVTEYTLALIQDSINTTAGDNYGKRKVWIKATPNSGNAVEVSAATLSDYRTGWTAAYNQISLPSNNTSSASMTLKTTSSAVGGTAATTTYNLVVDNNVAYIKDGNNVKAQVTHNKYNSGFDADHGIWLFEHSGTSNAVLDLSGQAHRYSIRYNTTSGQKWVGTSWEMPGVWLDYTTGTADQGTLTAGSIIGLKQTNYDGTTRFLGKWQVPQGGSTSHSISVSSQNIWHGQSRADVLDRMGISSFSHEWGIGSGSPYWGFKASCGGSTRNFLVYRA